MKNSRAIREGVRGFGFTAGLSPYHWLVHRLDLQLQSSHVISFSGAVGFVIGSLVRPTPLVSLESAQVVAGVVHLPSDNAMGVDHTSVYSFFLIQLPALLLKLGISETTLAVLGSGFQCALAFAALSACTLAFSQSALLSIALPILILRIPTLAGHKYPILFPNDAYDAGLSGLFGLVLVLSLLALRYRRAGPLLLGMLPSLHITLGFAAWVAAGTAFLIMSSYRSRQVFGPLRYFLAGAIVFVASYTIQIVLIARDATVVANARSRELASAFMDNWDVHRHSAGFASHPLRMLPFFEVDFYFVVLALCLLFVIRRAVPEAGRFIVAGALGCTLVGVVHTALDEFASGTVLLEIRSMMLTRWLNVDSILLPCAVLGIIGYLAFRKGQSVALLLLLASIASIVFGLVKRETILDSDWQGLNTGSFGVDRRGFLFPVLVALVIVLGFLTLRHPVSRRSFKGLRTASALTLVVLTTGKLFVGILPDVYRNVRNFHFGYLRSTESDKELLRQLRTERSGLLIVPPPYSVTYQWPQLATRRGLVLDTDILDLLTYAPAAAPSTERALNKIYGTTVYDERGWGSFSGVRSLWESRGVSEWRDLGIEFGARYVLVKDWQLNLPVLGRSTNLIAYRIPR